MILARLYFKEYRRLWEDNSYDEAEIFKAKILEAYQRAVKMGYNQAHYELGEIYLEGKKVSDSQNFLDPRELKATLETKKITCSTVIGNNFAINFQTPLSFLCFYFSKNIQKYWLMLTWFIT